MVNSEKRLNGFFRHGDLKFENFKRLGILFPAHASLNVKFDIIEIFALPPLLKNTQFYLGPAQN